MNQNIWKGVNSWQCNWKSINARCAAISWTCCTGDAAQEKHVPVIEKIDGGYKVKVGSVPHPMEEKHLIEWIELLGDGQAYRQFLNPGDAPEAVFKVVAESVSAREFCNLHGLWKG